MREDQGKCDARLIVNVGRASDFLEQLAKKENRRRQDLRESLDDAAKKEIQAWIAERRSNTDVQEFRRVREAQKKRYERDGLGVSSDSFDGFYGYQRKADGGKRVIYWGRDLDSHDLNEYVVLTFNNDTPLQSFKLNMKVIDAWICECADKLVLKISNEGLREREREFFVFLNEAGEVVHDIQFPSRFFQFLGISEYGTHYVWTYKEWLHLTDIDSGLDFLNRKIPRDLRSNVVDFDTELSELKLRAWGGIELTICWEDTPEGDYVAFVKSFNKASGNNYKAQMIWDYWGSYPEPSKKHAELFLPLLDEINSSALCDDSHWKSNTISKFMKMCISIYGVAELAKEEGIWKRRLDEYENPFKVADGIRSVVICAIKSNDDDALKNCEKKILKALETMRLNKHEHYLTLCYRYLGEIAQYFKEWDEAKNYYDMALEINEAAGCKRNLAYVTKLLNNE